MAVRSGICLTGKSDVMAGVGLGDSDWGKGVSGSHLSPDDDKGKCGSEIGISEAARRPDSRAQNQGHAGEEEDDEYWQRKLRVSAWLLTSMSAPCAEARRVKAGSARALLTAGT